MNTRPFIRAIALFFAVVLIAPSALFVAPQKAHAWTDIPAGLQRVIVIAKETLTELNTYTTELSDIANDVNTFVLQPLAFVLSGNLMKMLTASVVSFVIGKANGTGLPQFATDVQGSIRTVQTSAALAYLKQVGLTGSPFAGSIAEALNTDYLTRSSLAGFWNTNMCTLRAGSEGIPASANIPAYLAGNWSQGGVAAWFTLTTETQNNPYTLYQNTQAQLANVIGPGVGGVSGVREQVLAWGKGIMSWCGANDPAAPAGNNPDEASASVSGGTRTITASDAVAAQQTCLQNGGNQAGCQSVYDQEMAAIGTSVPVSSGGGINPGDPCTTNGVPGTIKTPGSLISDTLSKVLGGQQDEIVRMGNIGPQITSILGNIANIVNTVKFASSILGGDKGNGGLFGVGDTSSSNSTPALTQFTPAQDSAGNFTSDYAGVSTSTINQSQAGSPLVGAFNNDLTTRVNMYKTAWITIGSAANTANGSVASLRDTCLAAAATAKTLEKSANTNYQIILQSFITSSTAQADAAQTALTVTISPVIAQAADAAATSTAALAMVARVKSELESGSSAYSADLQNLLKMPPTADDISNAQKNAQLNPVDANSSDQVTANPTGSLVVSGGTLVDQMTLLNTNALGLVSSCAVPPDPGTGA